MERTVSLTDAEVVNIVVALEDRIFEMEQRLAIPVANIDHGSSNIDDVWDRRARLAERLQVAKTALVKVRGYA